VAVCEWDIWRFRDPGNIRPKLEHVLRFGERKVISAR